MPLDKKKRCYNGRSRMSRRQHEYFSDLVGHGDPHGSGLSKLKTVPVDENGATISEEEALRRKAARRLRGTETRKR